MSAEFAQDSSRKQCHGQISGALAGFQDYNMITASSQGWNMLGAEMWSSWAALKNKQTNKNNPATIWQMWKNPYKLSSICLLGSIPVMNLGTRARILWQYLRKSRMELQSGSVEAYDAMSRWGIRTSVAHCNNLIDKAYNPIINPTHSDTGDLAHASMLTLIVSEDLFHLTF